MIRHAREPKRMPKSKVLTIVIATERDTRNNPPEDIPTPPSLSLMQEAKARNSARFARIQANDTKRTLVTILTNANLDPIISKKN